MRRPLKCGNERNPYRMLQVSYETAPVSTGEEGEDDVKSARPLRPGLHTSYNGADNRSRRGNPEPILINGSSVQIEG